MQKIKMPDWGYGYFIPECIGKDFDVSGKYQADMIDWFKENIEGKYLVDESDLVEVEGRQFDNALVFGKGEHEIKKADKKAYLIKSSIEPIKKWKCPCGTFAMFADTEDCRTPLCHACAMDIQKALGDTSGN